MQRKYEQAAVFEKSQLCLQSPLLELLINTYSLQSKVPGIRSVISKASSAKADLLVEPGDKIFVGDLFLEVGVHIFCKFNLIYPSA